MSDLRSADADEDEREDGLELVKRAVAAVAIACVGELVMGRRALIAYEAVRRAARWAAEERRQGGEVPSAQQAMEEALEDMLERSRRAFALTRPKLEKVRRRTRDSLSEPTIGAIVSGGAAVAVVATIGLVPAAIGASTACLFRYYANAEADETEVDPLPELPATTGSRV